MPINDPSSITQITFGEDGLERTALAEGPRPVSSRLFLEELEELQYSERRFGYLKERNSTYKLIAFAAGAIFIIISIIAYKFPTSLPFNFQKFAGIIFITGLLMIGLGLYIINQEKNVDKRLKNITRRRNELENRFSPVKPKDTAYFEDLVDMNIKNLKEYYGLVKIHTEKSFQATRIAAITGFILIVFGLVIGFVSPNSVRVADISTASGVIIEFIAGVFFYLYNRTVRQLKEYHDSLLGVQNILLSFKIVGDLKEDEDRVNMLGIMLSSLCGKHESEINPEKLEPAIIQEQSQDARR